MVRMCTLLNLFSCVLRSFGKLLVGPAPAQQTAATAFKRPAPVSQASSTKRRQSRTLRWSSTHGPCLHFAINSPATGHPSNGRCDTRLQAGLEHSDPATASSFLANPVLASSAHIQGPGVMKSHTPSGAVAANAGRARGQPQASLGRRASELAARLSALPVQPSSMMLGHVNLA